MGMYYNVICEEIEITGGKVMRLLQYVLEKINKVLADEFFQHKGVRIEALTNNIDYLKVWERYNKGELTVSDLNKIIWTR